MEQETEDGDVPLIPSSLDGSQESEPLATLKPSGPEPLTADRARNSWESTISEPPRAVGPLEEAAEARELGG